jgi:hypothetical protein
VEEAKEGRVYEGKRGAVQGRSPFPRRSTAETRARCSAPRPVTWIAQSLAEHFDAMWRHGTAMTDNARSGGCRKVLLVALLSATGAVCQTQQETASRLISALTHQSGDRPDNGAVLRLGCGRIKEDRALAKSLVNIGVSAIPAIEEVMDSVERQGDESRPSCS